MKPMSNNTQRLTVVPSLSANYSPAKSIFAHHVLACPWNAPEDASDCTYCVGFRLAAESWGKIPTPKLTLVR
jgi:hypothetical protein